MKTTIFQGLKLALAISALFASCKRETSPPDALGTGANAQAFSVAAGTFQNPVIPASQNPKDPQIMRGADNNFYLFHPNGANYKVFSSPDLVNWTAVTNSCFSKPTGSFWSAGTFRAGGKYLLYYTHVKGANNRTIGVASADAPGGPYQDANASLVVKQKANGEYTPVIDPSVFQDPADGKVYLFYARNVGQGADQLPDLRVVQLTADGLNTIAGTDQPVLTISQAWENINIEHPLVYYAPNAAASRRYYMLYNGSGGALARYAIGYAYSSSPAGPFTKAAEGSTPGLNPLVRQDPAKGIYGPGSPNTVVDDAGVRWLIYRIKTTAGESWSDRAVCVDELFRNSSDQLIVTPTKGTTQNAPFFN
ncbi:family 43 glycosylhydrolase [Pedobacter yulinensis]|nr:family 43 glycosylhydrolase [Pedobacter yulinensis]